MYLIIILECVKSSLDNNILRKYVFFLKMSRPLMWLNWSVAIIRAHLN